MLQGRTFTGRAACQEAFDHWRPIYNFHRPHEALDLQVPADRYEPSVRSFPHRLPPIEYVLDDEVRRVQSDGEICFRGRTYLVSKAFRGHPVALRPTDDDGVWEVYFCRQYLGTLDVRRSGLNVPDLVRMCYQCLRTSVTHQSGPYSREGARGWVEPVEQAI